MESQKIKNLLNYKDETYSRYQTKNGILLMIEIVDSMMKEMIRESRLIQKL